MTTHATPPETAGPQIPLQSPVPPMPATGPVFLSPVPADAPPPVVKPGVWVQTRRGCHVLYQQGRAWALLENVDDDTLTKEATKKRADERRKAIQQHRNDVRAIRKQLNDAAQQGHDHKADRYQQALASLTAAGPAIVHDADDEVTEQDVNRHRRGRQASRCAIVAAAAVGAFMYGPQHPILLAFGLLGAFGAAWWAGRERAPRGDKESSQVGMSAEAHTVAAPAPYGGGTTGVPAFDAPPPPALSEATVNEALRDIRLIKPEATVTMRSAPAWGKDGTATTVFDLPSGITVTMLKAKAEAFAGALGRDVSMVDIDKAGTASRASVWLTDSDPFERPRPSPLLMRKGGVDAWRDGIPVAWAKRGNTICLPVRDSHFVIAGMTRSGKGVGAANLAAGASLDVRINLRVVAGKTNGEFDPYARTGVAATYFKQTPTRLLALVKALLADMNRRNGLLGDLGKSKLTPQSIERLGGIELLIIDEVATFTRPGSHPDRDELLAKLEELASVATGAGIFVVLITQYPEADVLPQGLAMNCGTRWAMRVDNGTQSNAILGGGAASNGRDASKFDPPLPGLGWLVNPFAGVTDKARSFDLDEDERGEVTQILARAADLRNAAGRLVGQWDDPIERHLINATGLSSAGGGPAANGIPGKARALTAQEKAERDVLAAALRVMDELDRDAQLDEMASRIGNGMTPDRLGELLRAAGAGGTVKITVPHKPGRVNGYQRADVREALALLQGP